MADSAILREIIDGEGAIRHRWRTMEEAVSEVISYERRFGRPHISLACHFALPSIVDAELVNLIRINFLDSPEMPWIAEADYLLSPLCRSLGDGWFEVDPCIREVLLADLENAYGTGRPMELAWFLQSYGTGTALARRASEVRRLHRWISLAYLAPRNLVSELTDVVGESVSRTDVYDRLAAQVEVALAFELLADPLERGLMEAEYRDLSLGMRTIGEFWYGANRDRTLRRLAQLDPSASAESSGEGAKLLSVLSEWASATQAVPSLETAHPEHSLESEAETEVASSDSAVETPPLSYVDFEIRLTSQRGERYGVELSCLRPHNAAQERIAHDILATFDFAELSKLARADQMSQYGRLLGNSLFQDPDAFAFFEHARNDPAPMRLRLAIEASAANLHDLRWEALCHPGTGDALLTGDRVVFSRFLASEDRRAITLRSLRDARALIVIADPMVSLNYPLPPVDLAEEVAHVATELGSIVSASLEGPATLDAIINRLRREPFDILYLSCHGSLGAAGPVLYLEDEVNNVQPIFGNDLIRQLAGLERPPSLIVLAPSGRAAIDSKRSREQTVADAGALSALCPLLIQRAGIAAALAMQGDIDRGTLGRFMAVLFAQLRSHGFVDLAMTRARRVIRDRPDYWMPALFTRLRSGRLWYEPGVASPRHSFDRWLPLIAGIRRGEALPILGPGLMNSLVGSRRDIARWWSERFRYPFTGDQREDLAQVAQYLEITEDRSYLREEFEQTYRQEILRRFGDGLSPELRAAPLSGLITALSAVYLSTDPGEPHRILAELPFSIYLTTNVDNLLIEALRKARKEPIVVICGWNDREHDDGTLSGYGALPTYSERSSQRPVVFHLFGHIDHPESLALTEDDLSTLLVRAGTSRAQGVSGHRGDDQVIPPMLWRAISSNALIILGFDLNDRTFQTMTKIVSYGGSANRRLERRRSVAQLLLPDEDRNVDAEAVMRFAANSLQSLDTEIFWGTDRDFMRELQWRWMKEME